MSGKSHRLVERLVDLAGRKHQRIGEEKRTGAASPRFIVDAVNPVSDIADQVLQGNSARSAFGFDGTGITIGIISDSFNVKGKAGIDESDGALPSAANVHILQDATSGSDEGRAMAQIVHSIAPGAQIDFYTCGNTDANMATAITALQQAGCQIIVDDISFLDEPFYQQGSIISRAIDTAVAKGSSYFTAAGNASNAYYEGIFNPTPALTNKGKKVQAENFGTAANPVIWENVTIPLGATVIIDLQWNQPYATSLGIANGPGSANSLGFNLVAGANGVGTLVSAGTVNDIGGDPLQLTQYTNKTGSTSFSLAIFQNVAGGPTPGLFKIIMDDDASTPVTFSGTAAGTGSGDIFGHQLDPNAITVGAVPESNPTSMESFSSVGPGEFLFDANGNPLTQPVSANKVDLVAPDGNSTSVFNPFYGTSAAAPAAAAVGALVLQANAVLTPGDIENILEDTATPMNASVTVAGAGLVNAFAAVGVAETLVFAATATRLALRGTHLNDTFVGGAGNHALNGEGGSDTLDYSAAPGPVTVNFVTGTAANGYGGTDTFTGIGAVKGSAYGDSFIAGPAGETIWGEGGSDALDGASLASGGVLTLANGGLASASSANAGTIIIENGGTFQLGAASFSNSGLLEALSGAVLTIGGAVSGAGSLRLGDGASLVLGAAASEAIVFAGTATLTLDAASQFNGAITGLALGDAIDLAGIAVASTKLLASSLTLFEGDGTQLLFQVAGALAGNFFAIDQSNPAFTRLVLTPDYPPAQASIAASSVSFGNLRVGSSSSQAIAITNSAAAPAEALDASVTGTTGAATGAGAITLLAAGATDASNIQVGLIAATAGALAGTVTLGFASDGGSTDGQPATALASQTVQVSGTAYNEAAASVVLPANFIVHVGDTVAQALSITNIAPALYSENLLVAVASASGGITTQGSTGAIAAQASSNAITCGFSTAAAGTVSGNLCLALQTEGTGIDGFGPTDIGQQIVAVNATVDNYAVAAWEEFSGGGAWSQSGNSSALDLGTIAIGAAAPAITLGVLNKVSGPADLLAGSFSTSAPSGFSLSGFAAFSGLGAGEADTALQVTLDTSVAGTYSATITLTPTGSNASGYLGVLGPITLTITAAVAGSMAWQGPSKANRSGLWNSAANWLPGFVPNALAKAQINAGGTYTVTNAQANTVGSLTIGNASATLAISGGPLALLGASTDAGTIVVADGNTLQLAANFTDNGTLALQSAGAATSLQIMGSVALKGTGTVMLGNVAGNAIVSNGAAATLTNYIGISGGGMIGDANLTLINQSGGVIAATATPLTLATGANTIKNFGTIESAGGNLVIAGALANNGSLIAQSGTLLLQGAVSGAGSAILAGGTLNFAGTVSAGQSVSFGAGTTGTLVLGKAQSFAGTVAGLAAGDAIDLSAFVYSKGPTLTVSGTGAAGTATVVKIVDGGLTATLNLLNQYANQFALTPAAYALASDQPGNLAAGTLFSLAAVHA